MEKRGFVLAIVLIIGIAMFANFIDEKNYFTGKSSHNPGWTWKLDARGPSFGFNQQSSLNLCANPCLTKEDCNKYELPGDEVEERPASEIGYYQQYTRTYRWECVPPVCLDETTARPAYECVLYSQLSVKKMPL